MSSHWRCSVLALPLLCALALPAHAEMEALEGFTPPDAATPDFSDVVPLPPERPKDLVLAPVPLSFREAIRAAILERAVQSKNNQLLTFYAARDGAPLFVTRTGLSPKGQASLNRLARAEDDGLDKPVLRKPLLPMRAQPVAAALSHAV
jgi:L,D-transpeptidase YcbB